MLSRAIIRTWCTKNVFDPLINLYLHANDKLTTNKKTQGNLNWRRRPTSHNRGMSEMKIDNEIVDFVGNNSWDQSRFYCSYSSSFQNSSHSCQYFEIIYQLVFVFAIIYNPNLNPKYPKFGMGVVVLCNSYECSN